MIEHNALANIATWDLRNDLGLQIIPLSPNATQKCQHQKDGKESINKNSQKSSEGPKEACYDYQVILQLLIKSYREPSFINSKYLGS